MKKRSMSFIIKTVDFCNMNCSYCYAPRLKDGHHQVFPLEYVEKIIDGSIDLGVHNVQFVWHGNEPTLAGRSYFEQVIDIQKRKFKHWQKYSNVMQTNALLMNAGWIDFCKENNFGVGVSLDVTCFRKCDQVK